MATNKTQQETPANAERRGYWAGFKAGVAKGTNWLWAHRPSPIKLLYYVFGAIVIFLALYLLLGGRLTDLHGPTDFTQADIDAAVARAIAAQNNSTSNCPTGQIETVTFGCLPAADAQIVLGLEGRSNDELAAMLNPDEGNSNPGDTSNSGTTTSDTDTTTSAPVSLTCPGGWNVSVPVDGAVFEASSNGQRASAYDVVYDPNQSGRMDIPAAGWWYQPCLPSAPERAEHEVAITLQAGEYAFTGPECTAWLNYDQNHPFDTGRVLVNKANNEHLTVPATTGAGTEAWVFVRCARSDASGFSFAKR